MLDGNKKSSKILDDNKKTGKMLDRVKGDESKWLEIRKRSKKSLLESEVKH